MLPCMSSPPKAPVPSFGPAQGGPAMSAEPVIDAHHHIWRQADLPWLSGPPQPRIFGAYEAIRRDYGIEEYLADTAGCGVVASVYVQANWAPGRSVDEAAWVQSVADRHGCPQGIVAHADLLAPDCAATLETLSQFSGLRGIRQQLHWHENPQYRFAPHPDLMSDPRLRANLARLVGHDWLFELQVFPGQFDAAHALVAALPDLRFVLVHAGMLEDLSPEGVQRWRNGLARLGALPNLWCKLSAFGTFVRRLDPGLIATITAAALDCFGPGRCLWGSNFPIEKLWTGYAPLLQAHRDALAGLSAAERSAVLHDTAASVYRLA
jgi:predicted TIM-barrel fold metal-dependent hydrolase